MADDDPLLALTDTNKLVVKQRIDWLEVAANTVANALDMDALGALGETANKYDVFTDDGGLKFKVIESSNLFECENCCIGGRACCRPNHKLRLHMFYPEYSDSKEIMYADRPCKCGQCCACLPICKQEMHIYRGDDADIFDKKEIGYITQPFLGGFLSPTLQVMDREDDDVTATIEANATCCIGGICCDHTFTVKDADGNEIGKIVKEGPEGLGDYAKELGTDADNFTMYVPTDLPVEKKAQMLAALHLLDYMFFENEGAANVDMTALMEGGCPEVSLKICDLYCCGCLCPCSCTCGGGKSEETPEDGEPLIEAEEEPVEEEPVEEEPVEEEPVEEEEFWEEE